MAELKTKVNNASVNDFLNSVSNDQKRKDSFTLLQIFEKVTGEKAKMWGTAIVGFGMYHYKSERNEVMDVNEEVEQGDLDVINKVMKETGRDVMYRKKESVDMASFLRLKTEQWMLSQVWNNPGLSTEMSEKDRVVTDRMRQLNTELSELTKTSMVPRRNTFENTTVFQRVDRLNATLTPQTAPNGK